MLDKPLNLTVHSLPESSAAMAAAARTARGRRKMFAVLLICAAPVLASYLTFYVIRPDARRNYGELIEPQRPLPNITTTTLEGKPVKLSSLNGQWLLISAAGGACAESCERHLYLQRQLRESLGKDKDRLDWVWLVPDGAPVRAALRPALKKATVLRLEADQLAGWLQPAAGHQISEHLYLVDPLGHWMMRFPAGLDLTSAARAKRDLERLMRASASWDLPGRTQPRQ